MTKEENPAAYYRKWRAANLEKVVAYQRKWRQENREKLKDYRREYHLKHRQKRIEYSTNYNRNHMEHRRLYKRKYDQNNRALVTLSKDRWRLKKKYGLSLEQFQALAEKRHGKCHACGRNSGKRRLYVDHCHNTGTVRGLICVKCNSALGFMDEDPVLVQRLANYVAGFALLSRKVA